MDILSVRNQIKRDGISFKDLPLRVAYYARVSTDFMEQLNSLENQKKYFTEYIGDMPNWEFAGGYIDEGISGVTTKKREKFNEMIDDALSGQFDLIVTKEVSRFARNTLDSIQYTRKLLSNGVAVYFQNDNINTLDEDSEFRLTIMASMAQDESRKISSRVRWDTIRRSKTAWCWATATSSATAKRTNGCISTRNRRRSFGNCSSCTRRANTA